VANDLHRYENDLPRFLLTGVAIGLIVLLLTIVAYTIGRHQTQPANPTTTSPTTTAATSNSAQGQALFAQYGCGGCHTFAPAGATGTIGPNLATANQTAVRDHHMSLTAYLRQSIQDPNAYITPGYHSGVMPTTYTSLSPTQLQALISFIAAGQRK